MWMTQRPREDTKEIENDHKRYDRESVRSALCRIFFLYYNSQEMGDFILEDMNKEKEMYVSQE